MIHQCKLCPKYFETDVQLKKHVKIRHDDGCLSRKRLECLSSDAVNEQEASGSLLLRVEQYESVVGESGQERKRSNVLEREEEEAEQRGRGLRWRLGKLRSGLSIFVESESNKSNGSRESSSDGKLAKEEAEWYTKERPSIVVGRDKGCCCECSSKEANDWPERLHQMINSITRQIIFNEFQSSLVWMESKRDGQQWWQIATDERKLLAQEREAEILPGQVSGDSGDIHLAAPGLSPSRSIRELGEERRDGEELMESAGLDTESLRGGRSEEQPLGEESTGDSNNNGGDSMGPTGESSERDLDQDHDHGAEGGTNNDVASSTGLGEFCQVLASDVVIVDGTNERQLNSEHEKLLPETDQHFQGGSQGLVDARSEQEVGDKSRASSEDSSDYSAPAGVGASTDSAGAQGDLCSENSLTSTGTQDSDCLSREVAGSAAPAGGAFGLAPGCSNNGEKPREKVEIYCGPNSWPPSAQINYNGASNISYAQQSDKQGGQVAGDSASSGKDIVCSGGSEPGEDVDPVKASTIAACGDHDESGDDVDLGNRHKKGSDEARRTDGQPSADTGWRLEETRGEDDFEAPLNLATSSLIDFVTSSPSSGAHDARFENEFPPGKQMKLTDRVSYLGNDCPDNPEPSATVAFAEPQPNMEHKSCTWLPSSPLSALNSGHELAQVDGVEIKSMKERQSICSHDTTGSVESQIQFWPTSSLAPGFRATDWLSAGHGSQLVGAKQPLAAAHTGDDPSLMEKNGPSNETEQPNDLDESGFRPRSILKLASKQSQAANCAPQELPAPPPPSRSRPPLARARSSVRFSETHSTRELSPAISSDGEPEEAPTEEQRMKLSIA